MTDRHIWEDISTAPKDGTLMFLDYGDGVLYIGQWEEGLGRWWRDARVVTNVVDVDQVDQIDQTPRRWMAMPLPPLPYREDEVA